MAARRFLWIVAILITLVIAAAFIWRFFDGPIMRLALVPGISFAESKQAPAPDYAAKSSWLARPDIAGNPSFWAPDGYFPADDPQVSVFFVTPTTYLDRSSWNAPLDDAETNTGLTIALKNQATAFNSVGEVWSPKYRQATFGVFLTDKPDAALALDFAYADVVRAFDAFVAQAPADRPIIVAGHSQGSLHLLRLMKERVAGQAIAARIVGAYLVGWPISVAADLPALGLPPCKEAFDTNCVVSWQSFALPADPQFLEVAYSAKAGLTGAPRKGTPMLCVSPLNGRMGGITPKEGNLGALVPSDDPLVPTLEAARIPAKCLPGGILIIGEPPYGFGKVILPGNNFHVYDYSLFWANVRVDVERRLKSWQAANAK